MITSPVMIISPSFLKKIPERDFCSIRWAENTFSFPFFSRSPLSIHLLLHHGENISTHPSAQPRFVFSLGPTRYVTKASFDPSGRTSYSSPGTRQRREGKIDSEATPEDEDLVFRRHCWKFLLPKISLISRRRKVSTSKVFNRVDSNWMFGILVRTADERDAKLSDFLQVVNERFGPIGETISRTLTF